MDIWKEAKHFFLNIRDDIDIYQKFKFLPGTKQNEEADKFIAWWNLAGYKDYPHALILIYENLELINNTIGKDDVLDGFGQLQFKLVQFYRLLKINGFINE